RDGKIVLVNTQTEHLFGYPREGLLGKSFDDLVHQEVPQDRGDVWTTVTNRLEVSPAFVGRCADGSRICLEINFNPLETRGGPLLISTMRNITERKRRESHRTTRQVVRRLLAETTTLEKAAPVILQGICGSLGWDLGALWLAHDRGTVLR